MPACRLLPATLLSLLALISVSTSFAASDDDIPAPDAKAAAEIVALIQQLGDESYASREAATEKLLTYSLGRALTYSDMPAVRGIVREAAKSNYRFSSLVLGIAKSQPFQMRLKKAGR